MLRLEAVIKRSRGTSVAPAHEMYRQGDFSLDFTARKATIAGTDLVLSPKEYELLIYLVRNRNIALSREAIITAVWGYEYDGDDRTLDTHIKLLRKALGPYSDRISTLRSVGYRFEG
jgi:two-component system, OmpR family, response regulator ResD